MSLANREAVPTLVVDEWKETGPPAQILNPAQQLDDYLASIEKRQQSPQDKKKEDEEDDWINGIFSVVEFLFGKNMLQAAVALLDGRDSGITNLSTAHRSLYVVNGSRGEQSYMCMVGTVEYCGCRSFLEKTTKADGNGTICKHLLALKLMPYLKLSCPQITTNTETEFANLALDRTMGAAR